LIISRSVGQFRRGNLLAGGMGAGWVDDGLAAAVGGPQSDDGRTEQEDSARQQGRMEAYGERGSRQGVGRARDQPPGLDGLVQS